MFAAGGLRGRRRRAFVLALAAGTSALTGCQYVDDVGMAPAAVSPSAPAGRNVPAAAGNPEVAATEARNSAELDRVLGAPPAALLIGGAGGLGNSASQGFTTAAPVGEAGRYTVTAACVGAAKVHLAIRQGGRQGGTGATVLELHLECGAVASFGVALATGSVSAHVTKFPQDLPDDDGGAVAGVRISASDSTP